MLLVDVFWFIERLRLFNFTKKRLWHGCFPVNFAKFLRTQFLTEHLRWLLLKQIQQPKTQQSCKVFLNISDSSNLSVIHDILGTNWGPPQNFFYNIYN